MRQLSLFLVLFLGCTLFSFAQPGFDVTKVLADPNTQVFNDGKHTVNSFLYSSLESESACCGNDAIYLEVKIDQQGYVTGAKTLTGKNDCYRKSITDAVKNVRWVHEDIRGTRTIYFEVKPVLPCSGSPNENEYNAIAITNNPNFGSGGAVATNDNSSGGGNNDLLSDNTGMNTLDESSTTMEETIDEGVETMEEEVDNAVADVEETVDEVEEEANNAFADEGFLTEETFTTNDTEEVEEVVEENTSLLTKKANNWNDDTEEEVAEEVEEVTAPVRAVVKTTPRKSGGKYKIPAQMEKAYNPVDHKPNESHNTTFANVNPNTSIDNRLEIKNQNDLSIAIKKGLREKGVCGLANVLAEVTVNPSGGVVSHRVLQTSNETISQFLPEILSSIQLGSRQIRYNYPVLVQFKTDILCKDNQAPVNLKETSYYLNTEGID